MALLLATPAMRGQAPHPRWELTIQSHDTMQLGDLLGDLRFAGASGRVLLQYDDSAFQVLKNLRIAGGRISFVLAAGQRRFVGTVSDSLLTGTVTSGTRVTATWRAVPLGPETTYWPVPPRVIVRQLAMGSPAASERVPGTWVAARPDTAVIEREYRELATAAGMPALTSGDRAARASLMSLGLEEQSRSAARRVLDRIRHGVAADSVFAVIFLRDNRWKIDIHDDLLWEARHYDYDFRLLGATIGGQVSPGVANALAALGEIGPGVTDSSLVRQSAWRFWSRATVDSVGTRARLDTLLHRHDVASALVVRALLAGFDDATVWWRRALSWLLTHPWLDTPDGPRSPAQLMARFWGVDSLPLPAIEPTNFGDFAAMPSLGIEHIAPLLFAPGNGIAAEWLPHGGAREVFRVWRPLRWGETPLTVVIGGHAATVASPASQAQVHPASFFGDHDAIRIDPGIMPLAAVAAYVHEWNHLLAAQRRLAGSHPAAVVRGPVQLQLLEEDPWLSEGFAEWATDEVLRPAGASAAFLRLTQAEKRLAIADGGADDPHALGYGLVRAAAVRMPHPSALRDLLVSHLHDLPAVARAVGLSGGGRAPGITLQRPPTAVVIPEVTFTWDEGTASDLSRRLVISNTRSEP